MWAPRTPLLVRYHGYPTVYHARYALAAVDAANKLWVCVPLDSDVYLEDLSDTSAEIDLVRIRAVADVGLGRVPYGVVGGNVYDFQPTPTATFRNT